MQVFHLAGLLNRAARFFVASFIDHVMNRAGQNLQAALVAFSTDRQTDPSGEEHSSVAREQRFNLL